MEGLAAAIETVGLGELAMERGAAAAGLPRRAHVTADGGVKVEKWLVRCCISRKMRSALAGSPATAHALMMHVYEMASGERPAAQSSTKAPSARETSPTLAHALMSALKAARSGAMPAARISVKTVKTACRAAAAGRGETGSLRSFEAAGWLERKGLEAEEGSRSFERKGCTRWLLRRVLAAPRPCAEAAGAAGAAEAEEAAGAAAAASGAAEAATREVAARSAFASSPWLEARPAARARWKRLTAACSSIDVRSASKSTSHTALGGRSRAERSVSRSASDCWKRPGRSQVVSSSRMVAIEAPSPARPPRGAALSSTTAAAAAATATAASAASVVSATTSTAAASAAASASTSTKAAEEEAPALAIWRSRQATAAECCAG